MPWQKVIQIIKWLAGAVLSWLKDHLDEETMSFFLW